MTDCRSIDPLVTPYVDGELTGDELRLVEAHVVACAPCRSRVVSERDVRAALYRCGPQLRSHPAPAPLHARCAQVAAGAPDAAAIRAPHVQAWRWALAASLAFLIAGASIHQLTQSSVHVMAAELAADHVKCALMNALLGTDHEHQQVVRTLAAGFGWDAELPDRPDRAGLELVGARTCLYGQGRVAHLMYRRDGRLVSIYMLPGTERKDERVAVLGHRETVWSSGGRTFVLVARQPQDEVERLTSFMRASLR